MTEAKQESVVEEEADVCDGQGGGGVEEDLWPRFGPPLHGPAGGGQAVKETELTWPGEADK